VSQNLPKCKKKEERSITGNEIGKRKREIGGFSEREEREFDRL
jgi:hypothetical protein